jgi:hypothetical protein
VYNKTYYMAELTFYFPEQSNILQFHNLSLIVTMGPSPQLHLSDTAYGVLEVAQLKRVYWRNISDIKYAIKQTWLILRLFNDALLPTYANVHFPAPLTSPWRWKQYGFSKCWYPTTSLQCLNPKDHDMKYNIVDVNIYLSDFYFVVI